MSAQFGICNLDGKPVAPEDLDDVRPVLTPYGPDGEGYICKDNFAVLYRAFHTTKESRHEVQPYIIASGAVLTWDGRLDNREELIGLLSSNIVFTSTDVEIVAAAYEHWGTKAFAKLIGDWALSIWEARTRTLIFAKDFVGTRHLYYSVERNQVRWCTILDPLVLFADHSFKLEEEYIAGWLSLFPASHLTPYAGIHSIPPASFIRLTSRGQQINRYWDFTSRKRIAYNKDSEYEEHFRCAFAESVQRRLRSDSPVLAELSGGMDSSSIVCMADLVMRKRETETPRLDTLSYYDDCEPSWNERPYFGKVEEQRGRAGFHIDVASRTLLLREYPFGAFAATPNSTSESIEIQDQFSACLVSSGSRVLLSGIGGDEVLGGVPTAIPELADLLVRGRIASLLGRLTAWALAKRRTVLSLLGETLQAFLPISLRTASIAPAAKWINPIFLRHHKTALCHSVRLNFFGETPSFQENMSTLGVLQRQVASIDLPRDPLYEKRYPYLDRHLLEFLYAIPREQLVRPGQRRSLMRRALADIVPSELLDRKRKAFVARRPLVAISNNWDLLSKLAEDMVTGSAGVVDSKKFLQALYDARSGRGVPFLPITRTLCLELWLRSLLSIDKALVVPLYGEQSHSKSRLKLEPSAS